MLDTINTTKIQYHLVLYIMHDKKEFFVQLTPEIEKASVKYFTASGFKRKARANYDNCLETHRKRYDWLCDNVKNEIEQQTLAVIEAKDSNEAKSYVKQKRAKIVDALIGLGYTKIS